MRLISLWAILTGLTATMQAQDRCATLSAAASGSATSHRQVPHSYSPSNTVSTESTTSGAGSILPEEIVIPVVVHVVYRTTEENIGDDQIRSQIEALNADFNRENPDFSKVPAVFASLSAKGGIRFRLATSDPDGRATQGIVRRKTERTNFYTNDAVKAASTGGSDGWDSRQYLNVWVCSMPSNLQGYASFPGGPAQKDGIVIRYDVFGTRGRLTAPFDKGRTLTHEVGHWLGLRHLWGDTPCGDDEVHDTPRQRSGNRGIPQFPRLNTGCENGPNGDMFMNFMDFSDDAALLMFTKGQVAVMRAQFLNGGLRRTLLSSKALDKPWNTTPAVAAAPTVDGSSCKVYPNPASHSIRVAFSLPQAEADQDYSLTDAGGKILMSGRLSHASQPIDVSRLTEGVYLLRIGDRVTRFMKGR